MEQQVPVAQHLGQFFGNIEHQFHLAILGIQPVGAQGLLHGRAHADRFELQRPARLQPGEVQHIVHQPGESIGFVVGDPEKLLLFIGAELIAEVVQGFDVALDVEQRRAQFMGDVADKTALGCIQLHLSGEVLDGDSDAFEGFTTGITHCLQDDAQGAGRFPHAAAQVFTIRAATEQSIQGTVQLDGQQFR